MPNHVHAVLEVIAPAARRPRWTPTTWIRRSWASSSVRLDEEPDEKSPLVDFLREFKQETATEAAALLGRRSRAEMARRFVRFLDSHADRSWRPSSTTSPKTRSRRGSCSRPSSGSSPPPTSGSCTTPRPTAGSRNIS